jgi:hypothetical protein
VNEAEPGGLAGAILARSRQVPLAPLVAAVIAMALATHAAHVPVEALTQGCSGLVGCFPPRRPETLMMGYSAADFRAFLQALGEARPLAALGLLPDFVLIVLVTALLSLAAARAVDGGAFRPDTQRLLILLPFAYAAVDGLENLGLAVSYLTTTDLAAALPWVTAAKFGFFCASLGSTGLIALGRAATE